MLCYIYIYNVYVPFEIFFKKYIFDQAAMFMFSYFQWQWKEPIIMYVRNNLLSRWIIRKIMQMEIICCFYPIAVMRSRNAWNYFHRAFPWK